jgi:hypothetical protein
VLWSLFTSNASARTAASMLHKSTCGSNALASVKEVVCIQDTGTYASMPLFMSKRSARTAASMLHKSTRGQYSSRRLAKSAYCSSASGTSDTWN